MIPNEYGLPYDTFRPGQLEAIQWAYGLEQPGIIQAPTGSGKTALPRAISQNHRTISLVRTKALQQENYADDMGFVPLFGRGNYPCPHPMAPLDAMADVCRHPANMTRCPVFTECAYFNQRNKASASRRASLNYAYWFGVYSNWSPPEYLVLDEGHQLPDLVLEWAGCTINDTHRVHWDLPIFPLITTGPMQDGKTSERAVAWLTKVQHKITEAYRYYAQRQDDDAKAAQEARNAERFGVKISATLQAMAAAPNDWFIKSGPVALTNRSGEKVMGFTARPLTARHHFKRYFQNGEHKLLIMSATIGDPAVFAQELGIPEFEYHEVASAWSPQVRPVHALDVPRIGHNTGESGYQKQAQVIAKSIRECPKTWDGIVHTSSIKQAHELARRLSSFGLGDRVWVPQKGTATDDMIYQWGARMARYPGSIMVTWALGEGYNGTREKINIVAKVMYPALDEFEQRRKSYNGKLFLQRAAWATEQALGRSRRGRPEDYDIDGKVNGFVAIADDSWRWIKGYLSPALRESIVTNR